MERQFQGTTQKYEPQYPNNPEILGLFMWVLHRRPILFYG